MRYSGISSSSYWYADCSYTRCSTTNSNSPRYCSCFMTRNSRCSTDITNCFCFRDISSSSSRVSTTSWIEPKLSTYSARNVIIYILHLFIWNLFFWSHLQLLHLQAVVQILTNKTHRINQWVLVLFESRYVILTIKLLWWQNPDSHDHLKLSLPKRSSSFYYFSI